MSKKYISQASPSDYPHPHVLLWGIISLIGGGGFMLALMIFLFF